MKTTTLNLPTASWRHGLVAVPAAAALTIWIATSPRFLHPINPVPPSMSIACTYAALAALAAINVRASRMISAAIWTPTVTHLVLIAFASYSFLRLGHWPWYSSPDPSELKVPFFYGAAVLAVMAGALAIPGGALALIIALCDLKGNEWPDRAVAWLHHAAVLAFGTWLWIFEFHDKRLLGWLAD